MTRIAARSPAVAELSDPQRAVLEALNRLGAHDVIAAVAAGKAARESAHSLSVTAHILRGLARIELIARTDLGDVWGYYLTAAGLERVR